MSDLLLPYGEARHLKLMSKMAAGGGEKRKETAPKVERLNKVRPL